MAKKLGVTNEPEIQWFQLTKEDQFILMATDGFWDWMFSTQASYYIAKFKRLYKKNLDQAAQFLVNKALKKGLSKGDETDQAIKGKIVYDDMTLIVAFLSAYD